MNTGDRIKELRLSIGITQEELGNKVGVKKAAVNKWESGLTKNLKRSTIQKLSELFGVTPSYLMGMADIKNSQPLSKPVRINVYGSIPAGVPLEAIQDIQDWEEIPEDWTKGGKQYIALKVKGDSMYPKYLDGDTVIIQLQQDCESGQDCACYVNGYEATLKTVIKTPGKIELRPLNPNYPPKTYKHPGEVRIVGSVKELRRKP